MTIKWKKTSETVWQAFHNGASLRVQQTRKQEFNARLGGFVGSAYLTVNVIDYGPFINARQAKIQAEIMTR